MIRLLGLLIFVIDVIIVIDILRSNMDTEKKILWVLVVFLLPIIGPILYYVIGKK